MVMNIQLSKVTWEQLLRILLHITQVMLPQQPHHLFADDANFYKQQSVSGRLASVMFQVGSAHTLCFKRF